MSNDPTETTLEEENAGADAMAEEVNAETAASVQADLDRFRDMALRTQADFDNFRKRAAREKDEAVRYANAALLERILPVIDNFELGLTAAKQHAGASAILSGMEMVARQLQDFLRESGVEVVNAEAGTKFDPNVHEAVGQEASAEVEDGAVTRQLRKGFKLRDRLLRAAMVTVSKGTE